MLRGLLLGTSWGALLATVTVTTLSLVYSQDVNAPLDAVQPADIAAPVTVAVTPPQAAPVTVAVPPPEAAPAAQESAVDDDAAQPVVDAETSLPDTAASDDPVTAPAEMADTPTTMAPVQEPAAPSTLSELPNATPAAIQPTPEENAPTPDVQVAEIPKPTAPDQPEPPVLGSRLPQIEASPQTPAAPRVEAPNATAPETIAPETIAPETAAPETTAPETAAPKPNGQFDTARVPVPKMANLAPEVKTDRLPTISAKPETTEAAAQGTARAPKDAADLGALTTYAMAFENPDAKPMFSVILIDDPQRPITDDVLSHLPFALSFAIDAVREDASAVAARYRAAGFEVLMLTNLPSGASGADIEIAFGAYTRAIPEAIGVLDMGANGFLRGPSTATQIAGIMSEHGFGLVTPSKGLNSAQKAATREGVPSVLLFRELDEDAEKPSVIRRYLDRAAFRAAQEGSVIMLGRTHPDTIEALVTWALEDRAASVAIAPVSAVLLAQ